MADIDLDRLARTYGIRLLLQFGSTVTGAVHPGSDIDVAVLLERPPLTLDERAKLLHELQRLFPERDVDLAVLNHADPLFLKDDLRAVTPLAAKPVDDYLASATDEILAERYLERVIGKLQAAVRDIPEYLRRVHDYLETAS